MFLLRMALYQLLLRQIKIHTISRTLPLVVPRNFRAEISASFSTIADSTKQSDLSTTLKPTSLSARMSFLFEQIDEIDKQRQEKDETLQRIRNWRESKKQLRSHNSDPSESLQESGSLEETEPAILKTENLLTGFNVKELELVHPWTEWIELMERLVHQNYFDQRRKDEIGMMQGLGLDVPPEVSAEDKSFNFTRDFETVRTATINFGKDRFDILRSLSRQDIQMMVGHGCPSTDRRVVFSSKLLRKHTHLDEGDVCSSCSLRNSCEKAYLLTNKEDEARTVDVMRILLTYGFDPIDGSVENKSLMKMKFPKASVRKLLHDVVKLSSVPIDPDLPPPVIRKPPPKVKQPPPTPKRKVGRYDVEMKKGDWVCLKCDFMNFAKNTVCLQCDAKRPKRQLLPGEWECPQCNFLNYRRNTECFHCECKRPSDTYVESGFTDGQQGPGFKMDKLSGKRPVSNAWNFDFDDNESDGADVAAFEHADSQKLNGGSPYSTQTLRENSRTQVDGFDRYSRQQKFSEREYPNSSSVKPGIGFNDFDEEDDVDSYDVISPNEVSETSRVNFSELEPDSESEDTDKATGNRHAPGITNSRTHVKKSLRRKAQFSDSDGVDFGSDDEIPMHPKWKSSHVAHLNQRRRSRNSVSMSSDDDLDYSSASDDETLKSKRKENRWVSNEKNTAGFGRKKAESFSSIESDDDFNPYNDKKGGKFGHGLRRKISGGDSGLSGNKKHSMNNGYSGSSGSLRNKRGTRDNNSTGKTRHSKQSNFKKLDSRKRSNSFDRLGGVSSSFNNQMDHYQDDERHRRPRINVR